MSARRQYRRHHPRRISVRGVRRESPDLHKLGRVLLALAEANAEKAAEADAHGRTQATDVEGSDD